MTETTIVGLAEIDPHDDALAVVGGKGLGLARLVQAGFDVPAGFVVTTDAYRDHVRRHGLDTLIRRLDDGGTSPAEVRAAFAADPERDLLTLVHEAYRRLGHRSVAVRSSATAEDLGDASFAGQQDTMLAVVDEEQLTAALVACWASLFTDRAVEYRRVHGIPHEEAALAVVVQVMVEARTSGVMFSADPVSGRRDTVVVESVDGLGEALVSGQVEPDRHAVRDGRIVERVAGARAAATRSLPGGGVELVSRDDDLPPERPALSDEEVLDLARIAGRVQEALGTPQDIEWAIDERGIHLLQSRAITSLFPLPSADPHAVWLSFAAVQGMLDPITPLGRDALRSILGGVGIAFGSGGQRAALSASVDAVSLVETAAERLWIRLDRALATPLGRVLLPRIVPFVEPGAAPALRRSLATGRDPGGTPARRVLASLAGPARMVRVMAPRVVTSLRAPEVSRARLDAGVEALLADARDRVEQAGRASDPVERFQAQGAALRATATAAFPRLLPLFGPIIVPAVTSLAVATRCAAALDRLVPAAPGEEPARDLILAATRALPGNVTTEMDLGLWDVASRLRSSGAPTDADIDAALAPFVARYGARGVGEIDLGRARWAEDPTGLRETVRGYLDLPGESAPDAVFARSAAAARVAMAEVASRADRTGLPVLRPVLEFALTRFRGLMPARESPKFALVRALAIHRDALLACGDDLVEAGVLHRRDDVMFLHLSEIAAGETPTWPALVAERREAARRESRRRDLPRLLFGTGETHYGGLAEGLPEGSMVGSGVSPGTVEGVVRVVHDPHRSGMQSGEILVCRGTDPAWTPLFLLAGGLITEVGGMMTHGSVVAREYGIPAVVGVRDATTTLVDGTRIRLDGGRGTVTRL